MLADDLQKLQYDCQRHILGRVRMLNNIIKNSLISVIFLFLLASAMQECRAAENNTAPPASQSEKVLTFLNTMNDEENETLFELIKEYKKIKPDVKIQVENVSFYDSKSVIEKRFKENNLPDVMRVEIRLVIPYARQGMFCQLDKLIDTADYVDYLPYLYKFSVIDGKALYAIPQVTDCLALFYNKAHLKDAKLDGAPKNMEQFLKYCRKLTLDEEGNSSDSPVFNPYKIARYGFSYHFESYYLLPVIFSFGGNLIDENCNSLIKTAKVKSALQFIYDLKNKYGVVPAKIDPKFGHDFTLMEFMDGRISMIIDGPWNIKKILKGSAFASAKENLAISLIPRGEVSGAPIGGQFLAVSSKCKYPKEAYEFINYINSKDAQLKFCRQNFIIPTRKSAMTAIAEDRKEPEYSIRQSLFEQMKFSALYAFNIPEPEYMDELNKMVEKLLGGQIGFEDALTQIDSKFKEITSKNKK